MPQNNDEFIVTGLESFIRQLPKLSEKMSGNYFYRGQPDESYKLLPSVLRDRNAAHEHEIYSHIMTECAGEFENGMPHVEVLTKMQHYGVPTRLLDITENPLVALYFACSGDKEMDKNGKVFCLRAKMGPNDTLLSVLDNYFDNAIGNRIMRRPEGMIVKSYDSDTVTILSCLPCLSFRQLEQIRVSINQLTDYLALKEWYRKSEMERLLYEIRKERPYFEPRIIPGDLMANFYYVPRKTNPRIIRQSGAFIIFGMGGLGNQELRIEKTNKEAREEEPLGVERGSYAIVIPREYKRQILDQLRCFGISTESVYPELYKVAQAVKEKFYM